MSRVSEIIPMVFRAKPKQYEYGTVMLHLSFYELDGLHAAITPIHIYTPANDAGKYTLDDDPHITLLYGLHNHINENEVADSLSEFTYSTCKINNVSLFQNGYDVLKFDVSGENLSESNEKLKELPHYTDYPTYQPHLTIAYLNKGFGERYVKRFANKSYSVKPKHIVYTKPNGKKYKIDINYERG